jgi:hypothetical protein
VKEANCDARPLLSALRREQRPGFAWHLPGREGGKGREESISKGAESWRLRLRGWGESPGHGHLEEGQVLPRVLRTGHCCAYFRGVKCQQQGPDWAGLGKKA